MNIKELKKIIHYLPDYMEVETYWSQAFGKVDIKVRGDSIYIW